VVVIAAVAAIFAPGALLPVTHVAAQETGSAGLTADRDRAYLSANALLGGLTAGVSSSVRGGPFLEPFVRGAIGGAISYGGKRLSGADFSASGLIGRQVAAAGASMVRSAAFGDGWLDTLFVPLGPGRLHVPLRSGERAAYRIDLEEVAWLLHGLTQDHLTLDVARTVSSGAFVFTGEDQLRGEDDTAIGRASPGVISIRRSGAEQDDATLAHERVHIAQLDYLKIVGGLPLEGALRRTWGLEPGGWHDHVEVGIGHYPMLWLLTAPWRAHGARPLEREAEHVEAIRAGGAR